MVSKMVFLQICLRLRAQGDNGFFTIWKFYTFQTRPLGIREGNKPGHVGNNYDRISVYNYYNLQYNWSSITPWPDIWYRN